MDLGLAMLGKKRKLELLLSFTTLFLLALAVGCTGFFQNPTLTGLTIGPPTPSIQEGKTLQMSAVGTYDDGSTKTLGTGVIWQSSDITTVTVSSSGLVTGVAVTTTPPTITASSGTVSATTTVTVVLVNVTKITISPSNQGVSPGSTVEFTATATQSDGTTANISGSATWTITLAGATSPDVTCTFDGVSQEDCTADSSAAPGSYSITVTYPGATVTGTATLNVS